jgi:hypothetical protein
MNALGWGLIIAGVGITGYVVYSIFFDPDRQKNLVQELKQLEKEDPNLVGELDKVGINLHKFEGAFEPGAVHGAHSHPMVKAHLGRFIGN